MSHAQASFENPDTQQRLRTILSHPRDLRALDKSNFGPEEWDALKLMTYHFSLMIDATDTMEGSPLEVKDHSLDLANFRMIENLAKSVENGMGAWEQTVLTPHDLRKAGDAFRLRMLAGSSEEYGTNITTSEALCNLLLTENDKIAAVVVVKEGKIRPEEHISADGGVMSRPTFSVTATPILFCQGPEEDKSAFGEFLSSITTSLTESLDANLRDSKEINDAANLELTTDAILNYYQPLGALLESAEISLSDIVTATKLPSGGLTELVKDVSSFLGWYREELQMFTQQDLAQFGAILKDLTKFFPQYLELSRIVFLAMMYADLNGAKMTNSPLEIQSGESFSEEFAVRMKKQDELIGERKHALTFEFYHAAHCILNDRGRESFRALLVEGKIAVDTFRLQPLIVLNDKPIDEVRACIDSALEQSPDTSGAIRFSDSRWHTWSS